MEELVIIIPSQNTFCQHRHTQTHTHTHTHMHNMLNDPPIKTQSKKADKEQFIIHNTPATTR